MAGDMHKDCRPLSSTWRIGATSLIVFCFTLVLVERHGGNPSHASDVASSLKAPNVEGKDSSSASAMMQRIAALEEDVSTLRRRFWLEQLEPIWNYRPKLWLGKIRDGEDKKDQVIPFFLANFVDAAASPRRIYIDLGIKDFNSSLCWMMQHYPAKFDQIYGFECQTDFSNVAALTPDVEACIADASARSAGYTSAAEVVDSMKLFHNYIGVKDDPATTPPTMGLSSFLKENAREEDFVVLKMDVEGIEYELIERMLEDGTYKLVDDIFVEVHYHHPDMIPRGWGDAFPHSRNEAQALLQKARDRGMFIHPWP